MFILIVLGIYTEFIGKKYERALGGVTHGLARAVGIHMRVTAQRAAVQEVLIYLAGVLILKIFGERRHSHFKV